ncbi:N-acetylneuraminate synthase [Gillisia hiemivivida]|uniref:N-acetylneuraminate synthase n=1 Tax=Gillisia hiemivivida TaxID=291190 RepID=A0A5C6ZSM8_9FLAO|nr:N-acetylneuraminate synthase [Gillisia hiemivivida]TXD92856.1 N-acetylneuraminate synthase [Gillisia hiemivivida]
MRHVTIIAEAGVNHNGSLENAKKLVEVAAEAGADFVKFQTFKTELNLTKNAKKAGYQEKSTGVGESQYDMVKKLELSYDEFLLVKKHCDSHGIKFLSTGFDSPSLEFLETLSPEFYKIPSGEITNLPYLRKIASFGRNVIMSTGMANIQEVKNAFEVLRNEGLSEDQISIIHCNTEYPTPMEDVNLRAMLNIKEKLGVQVGYSDHTLGIEVSTAAVAMGAMIIEKHFTLDRNMPGPDHSASLEPVELKNMVRAIRNIEIAIGGSGIKEPSPSEAKNKPIARKSIVASQKILKGEVFSIENLSVKRPGTGISPMKWDEVIGLKAIRDFREDDLIELV